VPDAVIDVTESTVTISAQRAQFLSDQLEAAGNQVEVLSEALIDIEMAREDAGWKRIGAHGDEQFTREGLRNSAQLCRVMAIGNPMLKRGLSLRTAYIWGDGVQIAARATGENAKNTAEQDVNTYLQKFLDDDETKRTLTGAAAHERNERTLGTDGNIFTALFTNRVTGWVRPRLIPFDEISRVISNPEDRLDRWFFLREWTEQIAESGTLAGTIRYRKQTRRMLYPSISYRPLVRPRMVDGVPVDWDAPIAELNVNALDTWDFGIGDAFAVLPWVKSYADFLTDWAKLVKSLSRFAFKATAPSRSTAQKAAAAQAADVRNVPAPRGLDQSRAGATAHLGAGQNLEAIPKTGATIDSGSGRPLASMVAAGLDIPVTMLLGDPGVTGARATAETLDKPTELMATIRREIWSDYLRRVCGYVIDQAAKAPGGPLKRAPISRDVSTGREIIELAGDTDRTVEVTWPDLSETSLKELMDAIVAADGTGKMPPLETLKAMLHALGTADVDDIIKASTDEQGRWIDPRVDAGQAAVDDFRNGGGTPTFDAPPPVDDET
jgi:hypothetical protein